MIDQTHERQLIFHNAWCAYFEPLTETSGKDYWAIWIDDPFTDIDLAIEAVKIVGEKWRSKGHPRLGKIKSVYKELKQVKNSRYSEPAAPEDCAICGNTGFGFTIAGRIRESWYIARLDKQYEELRTQKHLCQCSWAMKFHGHFTRNCQTMDDYVRVSRQIRDGWNNFYSTESDAQNVVNQLNKRDLIQCPT